MSRLPSPKLFFLRLLIPLACGIIIGHSVNIPYLWQSCVIAALPLLFFERLTRSFEKQYHLRWLYGVGVWLFLTGAGIANYQWAVKGAQVDLPEGNTLYTFSVIQKQTTAAHKSRLLIRLHDYRTQAYLYLPSDSLFALHFSSDSIYHATLRLSPVGNRNGNNQFDYRFHCLTKGITHQGFFTSYGAKNIQSSQRPDRLFSASHWRERFDRFISSLPLNESEQAVILGITLGDTNAMDSELLGSFRYLGIAHLLAVSGLHVGILYGLLLLLLTRTFERTRLKRLSYPIAILFLALFCWLVGFSPSVTRASVMCIFLAIASLIGRPYQSVHALFATAFLLLLFDPLSFFSVGFQLSFMSVLSIILAVGLFNRRVHIENRVLRSIALYTTVCLSAQIGVLPLSLHYFSNFQPFFLLPNLLIVPLIPLFILLVFLLLLLGITGIEIAFPLFLLKQWMNLFFGITDRLHTWLIDRVIHWEIEMTDVCLLYALFGLIFLLLSPNRTLKQR